MLKPSQSRGGHRMTAHAMQEGLVQPGAAGELIHIEGGRTSEPPGAR